MEVIIAENAGFCAGVDRAIRIAYQACYQAVKPVYCLGELIHNPQVVRDLTRAGIETINSFEGLSEGSVIIRSHGVRPEVIDTIQNKGLQVVDATCPHVKRAQKWAGSFADDGFLVVIVGDRGHPEVEGILGWAGSSGIVVENALEAESLPNVPAIALISQTTQRETNVAEVEECLRKKTDKLVVRKTICLATQVRQQAAGALAKKVDLMLVVGGRNSANTRKLVEICSQYSTVAHVETAADLDPQWFQGIKRVGVTAGASTPHWIIEEVVNKMVEFEENGNSIIETEENTKVLEETAEDTVDVAKGAAEMEQAEVEARLAESMQELRRGAIVTGEVVKVTLEEVLVDVGAKSEAILPISELSAKKVEDPAVVVNVGDKIEVQVINVENDEGHPVVSKKRVDRRVAWEKLENSIKEGEELQATVIEAVKGGLLVDVGINGFVPASLVERGYVENLEQYVGQNLRLRVIELDRSKNKVVLSQKAILDEEHEKARENTWSELEEGQIIMGIVRRLTDFGAFVDIGGVDGLLHVSEISWGRVEHPRDVLSEGQKIEVKVLSIDRDGGKVSLGRKQLLANPWSMAANNYPVGTVVNGKVLRIAPFGAFVEVEPGVEGLVHISQLSSQHVEKTEDVVSVGEEIPVKVLSVDQDAQRMSLSLKEARNERPAAKLQGKRPKREAPKEEETGVTLGDLFGDLFEGDRNE